MKYTGSVIPISEFEGMIKSSDIFTTNASSKEEAIRNIFVQASIKAKRSVIPWNKYDKAMKDYIRNSLVTEKSDFQKIWEHEEPEDPQYSLAF